MRIKERKKVCLFELDPKTTFKNKGKHYTVMCGCALFNLNAGEVMCFCIEDAELVIFDGMQKGEVVDAIVDFKSKD